MRLPRRRTGSRQLSALTQHFTRIASLIPYCRGRSPSSCGERPFGREYADVIAPRCYGTPRGHRVVGPFSRYALLRAYMEHVDLLVSPYMPGHFHETHRF